MELLETLEICSSRTPDSAVIWLHGLGADGHDFETVVEELRLPSVRFILPHAPYRPVTINNGYSMRAWFDLYGLEAGSPQDEAGIRDAQAQIELLIERERRRGIVTDRIMLAGFSQGGAIALHTALRHPERLGGVLGLSTYLPLKFALAAEAHASNRDLPIFLAHGTFDNVIGLQLAEASADFLRQHGYQPEWHEYAMAHSVCLEEIAGIRGFIYRALK